MFKQILGTAEALTDCWRVVFDQLVYLRWPNTFVLTHPIHSALDCDSQRVDRRLVFFFKPQGYCRFQLRLRRTAVCDHQDLRQEFHAELRQQIVLKEVLAAFFQKRVGMFSGCALRSANHFFTQ